MSFKDFAIQEAIRKVISGIGWPASKQEILTHAETNGAPPDAFSALKQIPDKQYNDTGDVLNQIKQVLHV